MTSSLRRSTDRGIDWEAVKARLAHATEALRTAEQPSADQKRQILAFRAKRLAEVPDPTPEASEILELLTFRLGDDDYAIQTCYVREVLRPGEITAVPGVPSLLVGVMNLRGEVLAVIDLRSQLGSRPESEKEQRRVIVVGLERPEFGILADSVALVTTRPTEDLLSVPPSVSAEGRRYLKGVTTDAMLIIDGTLLLQDTRLFVDQDD